MSEETEELESEKIIFLLDTGDSVHCLWCDTVQEYLGLVINRLGEMIGVCKNCKGYFKTNNVSPIVKVNKKYKIVTE